MSNVAELIKDIRLQSKLTQKQFAKKFFVTEKTISNYENGLRSPSLEFLYKVCNEFNLTLDYFMEKIKFESNPKNLVVSEKNGKCAIYDKGQSIYLTPHIYDKIILSPFDYHIVYNAKDLIDEGRVITKMGDVTYSAIVNNFGKVKEVPNLFFSHNYNLPFNMFGTCPALNKEDDKYYLVDANGKLLSKGYDRIVAVDKWHSSGEHDFGLYYGLEYEVNKQNNENFIKSRKVLYVDGKEICVALTDINDNWNCKVKDFEKVDTLLDYIKKFGPNIIAITPNSIFQKSENYPKILNAVCDFVDILAERIKCVDFLKYALKLLTEYANKFNPKTYTLKQEDFRGTKIYAKNKIEKNNLMQQICQLYAIIGLK